MRLENLDTDLRPPEVAVAATRDALGDDDANSYLPFQGHASLRRAAAAHVGRIAGRAYDPDTECVSVAGGLNGVLNVLLATVEPGEEVVLSDPIMPGWSTGSSSSDGPMLDVDVHWEISRIARHERRTNAYRSCGDQAVGLVQRGSAPRM